MGRERAIMKETQGRAQGTDVAGELAELMEDMADYAAARERIARVVERNPLLRTNRVLLGLLDQKLVALAGRKAYLQQALWSANGVSA